MATYGDSTLTLSEFEHAYANASNINAQHNRNPAADSFAAYKKFLDQYIDYRLKVLAAREAGLDSLSSVQSEITSYRLEMARPKLMGSEVYRPLIRRLHERRQSEVDVSHISIRAPADSPERKKREAYKKIQALADSLEQGVPFPELAYRHSDAPSAQKKGQRGYKGRLGYVTAGQLVRQFEEKMYFVPVDSTSDVFRSEFGYHILKVHDRRPAQPELEVSHILLKPSSEEDSTHSRQLLDSLRTEIVQNGSDFSAIAKEYSDHRRSAARGGALGTVKSVESAPSWFQRAVTDLDTVGAISKVVESKYGYHLVKLTDRIEPPSFEEAYDKLKSTVSQSRVDEQKAKFARQVRREVGSSVDTTAILRGANVASLDTLSRPLLYPRSTSERETTASPVGAAAQDTLTLPDSISQRTPTPQSTSQPNLDPETPVASVGDSAYTYQQLSDHLMEVDGGAQMTIGDVVTDFLNEKAFRYAAARLEKRDSSFAASMKQYREGLLVFQFMQDSVWSVARRDTAGLRRTYRKRKEQYRYPDRVRAVVLRANADSLLTPYTSRTTDTADVSTIVERSQDDSLVTTDTMLVTEDSPEVYRRVLSTEDGLTEGPVRHNNSSLLLVRDTLLPAREKTFAEARSSVVRDYQKIYEEEVLSRLRRRYEVKTYPDRLRQAFDDASSTASSTP